MIIFNVKVHPEQRKAYIPKEVLEAFGCELKLLGCANAAVIWPKDKPLRHVIESVRLLLKDLEMRLQENE